MRWASKRAARGHAGPGGAFGFRSSLTSRSLTVVVHFLGSVGTFAPFMYLFHIVLACIFLPYARSLVVMLTAMGMYLACLALEAAGVVAPASVLAAAFAPVRTGVPLAVQAWQFGSVVFVSATVWYLASRLSNALRRRDEELSAINTRLEAATEERARHMLRTTHQLKAPFAAIHANTQLLLAGLCGHASRRSHGGDRADRGPVRDAFAGDHRDAAACQPALARPDASPARCSRSCGADPLIAWLL